MLSFSVIPSVPRSPVALTLTIAGAAIACCTVVVLLIGGCAGKDDPRTTTHVENATVESAHIAPPPVSPEGVLTSATESVAQRSIVVGANRPAKAGGTATVNAPAAPAPAATARRAFPNLLASASSSGSTRGAKPVGPSLDERLLFFPALYPDGDWQPRGLRVDDANFSSADGTRLHGWYCPVEKPTAVILYCHGNAGNITYDAVLLRFLQKYVRATTLDFDYRGYGRSNGIPTADGVVEDARAARAWLAQKAGVPESAVVLMGRSLGGAVAVQLTSDIQPRGLILESTFTSLRSMAEHHYPMLASVVPAQKFDSAAILADYTGPLLQSHGDDDRTIPFASGEALFLAAKGKKEFYRIPGGGHNDSQPNEYYGKLMTFVAELP